jgi:tetratricopeptide (TPR) repeat protein
VAFAKGEYLDALVRFQRAIELAGNNYPDAQFYQGLTQEQLGQEAEAIASFQSALERDAQSPWADEARAALVRLGQQ